MKKFGIIAVGISVLISSCGEQQKSLQDLIGERKELELAHKTALKEYNQELFTLDSLINVHPQNKEAVVELKKIPVTVKVEVKTFEHFFEVHGNVEVVENAALFAEAPGMVKKIHIAEGDGVRKGQILISLDAAQLESGIKELEKGVRTGSKSF